jgi:Ca-activated chloride channel homolog
MGLSALADFHFLQPIWLAALPLVWLLTSWMLRSASRDNSWAEVMDAQLLRVLRMSDPHRGASPWWVVGVIWTLALIALAGPAWRRAPLAAFRIPSAWVLVMDLSPSMSTADVSPDRATRAHYAASDLLAAMPGSRVGLVAFAGEAHTVAPLTTDAATVHNLLNPLMPKLMPEDGNNLAPALTEAHRLLRAGSAPRGQVVVLSDGIADPAAAFAAAKRMRESGATVHVVGIGRLSGAEDSLHRVATAGGGIYVSPAELPQLIRRMQTRQLDGSASESESRIVQWKNEGVWLLVPILLLGALVARRGWI